MFLKGFPLSSRVSTLDLMSQSCLLPDSPTNFSNPAFVSRVSGVDDV